MTSNTSTVRLITGASSGIGLALTRHWLAADQPVVAVSRHASTSPALAELHGQGPLSCLDVDITDEKALRDLAAQLSERQLKPEQIINCAGVLHDSNGNLRPEKRLEDVSAERLMRAFSLNSLAPILLARYLLPTMPRDRRTVFASLSARVGSIADNHLGGWYSYRASKAAQNQLLTTLAIESRRRYPDLCVLLLHPGTTDTPLSKPFQRNVPPEKLFSPERAARQLATLIDQASDADHGRFIAWDGQDIPW
ncbi:short chain dehydrogenase/reductase family oxidoreductase [Alcanivorax hongdengensis A-11-3]|uniref:Short chain dehydrogenase/reductase family oxidoreductase n=1 Tax=Alcanivorax hongdengensis A-11-3 TaxID=1177179 RepID=L0WBQ7_9GAMM|nr:SDR family NAD(P)-dependent oxidoreductase [Alcanivorax hongdengensis]EKF73527.1 short chain dehydrogenase/reductase family oxidoreductase [Alcanivorax hongdengensis A-11-3]